MSKSKKYTAQDVVRLEDIPAERRIALAVTIKQLKEMTDTELAAIAGVGRTTLWYRVKEKQK